MPPVPDLLRLDFQDARAVRVWANGSIYRESRTRKGHWHWGFVSLLVPGDRVRPTGPTGSERTITAITPVRRPLARRARKEK